MLSKPLGLLVYVFLVTYWRSLGMHGPELLSHFRCKNIMNRLYPWSATGPGLGYRHFLWILFSLGGPRLLEKD
jgi:hypothetical protein